MTILSTPVRGLLLASALTLACAAQASPRSYNGVPDLNVKGSCQDAQKFSAQGDDKGVAYKGCMQDEMNAKDQLAKRWSSFRGADKTSCVEQARTPSPSYVEVLTCLEMNTDSMNTGGRATPQIGGASAPGLANPSTPNAPK
jgi:hypothetical protein